MSNELIENIDKVHTTAMGIDRIRKNLGLDDIDVVAFCMSRILGNRCDISVTKYKKNLFLANSESNSELVGFTIE